MDIADIVQKIEKEYEMAMKYDKDIASLYDKVSAGTATYTEASKFAEISGQHIGNVLVSNLAESFPDGITIEDALQLVPPPLRENHEYVAAVAEQAQKTMNEKAGVGLKPVVPEFDFDGANTIAGRIADGLTEEQIKAECVKASRHTVDNSMRENARAHDQAGLRVRVTRKYDGVGLSRGRECTWCLERCGEDMTYSEAYDKGAFERHPGCGCELLYITGKSTQRQVNWQHNQWEKVQNDDIIKERKQYGLENGTPRFKTANMSSEDYAKAVEMWKRLEEYPGLSGKEKEWVYEQFDNNLTLEEKKNPLVCRPFGNNRYYAVNRGHNQYKIYYKEPIEPTSDVVDEVLTEMFGPGWQELLDE